MTRILLSGSEGKMGKALQSLISKDKTLELKASFDKKISSFNFEKTSAKDLDVVLDFSSPELFFKMLSWSKNKKIPFVSGTTGLTQKMKNEMKAYSKEIPIFWASNMSFGIALLTKALNVFASYGKEFDFQIEEIHHKFKKDFPSGTALSLQERLSSIAQKKLPEALSIRGGSVYGIHRVWAFSEGETLSFEHTAMDRTLFAKGALKALKWILPQNPGLYGIEDILKKTDKI